MPIVTVEQDDETREQLKNIQKILLELKEDVAFLKSQFTSDSKDVNAEYYYSVRKVCEFLGISASTLYNWIKELKFPAGQLVGGRRRFLGSEVQAWLDMEKRGH